MQQNRLKHILEINHILENTGLSHSIQLLKEDRLLRDQQPQTFTINQLVKADEVLQLQEDLLQR